MFVFNHRASTTSELGHLRDSEDVGFVQDLIRFVHVRNAIRRFCFALENDLSGGQTYFTSEGKLYSCSEVCRVLSRIFGRKRSVVGILKRLAKALVYPVHLTEIVGGG